MGLFGKPKAGGFMDEICCDEASYLIWKWHPYKSEYGNNNRENAIRWGSSLRVKDGEIAVFVYKQDNGTQQDFIMGPANCILETKNLPVLASIIGLAYEGGTPFQAEVYFINLAKIIQVKFGVPFFDKNSTVVFYYYKCKEIEPNLTVDNCPELAAMLTNKAEMDDSYSLFVEKYAGRIIEFNGRIDSCKSHGNFKTRFDYLLSAGDYDPDSQIGPTFKFENVNYYDLNTNIDTVGVGLNVHIVAEVVSYNSNTGSFFLDPVSITSR